MSKPIRNKGPITDLKNTPQRITPTLKNYTRSQVQPDNSHLQQQVERLQNALKEATEENETLRDRVI